MNLLIKLLIGNAFVNLKILKGELRAGYVIESVKLYLS